MARFLVCPPDYFGIEYEINPWMRVSNAVDPGRSKAQWQNLMQTLEEDVGAELQIMTPIKGYPDLVFTANAGLIHDGVTVVSQFRQPERQREEKHFERWFTEHGYLVTPLGEESYFEGAGDLLGFDDVWFGGYRQRSDIGAYTALAKIYGKEILPLELVNDKFYHLDTCFCPLSGGELLYYPSAFDSYALNTINDRVAEHRRLIVPQVEAERFACNAVCVDRHVVLPTGCDRTMDLLKHHGYIPHPIELNEFMKSGGSAKCLTLALD
jgi:N-dimethylarginine dimethylaminohydrolase